MLQEQRKGYEAKMEEYEALQLEKRVRREKREGEKGGSKGRTELGIKIIKLLQWNPSHPDTIESVLIREVSLFQGLKSTQTWCLGKKKVSSLKRCPYFRGVLIDEPHCRSIIALGL